MEASVTPSVLFSEIVSTGGGAVLDDEIELWRQAQLARSEFHVRRIGLSRMPRWFLKDGSLMHESGGFFSVVGLSFRDRRTGAQTWQPFILQPEIGILGFMLCRREGEVFLLVQAKTEPGNHGGTQLSPSFQCTESNYQRRHGGTRAPFLSFFDEHADGRVLTDSRQSEQGTRFVNKYNRNMLVEVPVEAVDLNRPKHAPYRWISFKDIQSLIIKDLLFNTDARSVIAVSDWGQFCACGRPFERWASGPGFGHELWKSYRQLPTAARIHEISGWLESRRKTFDSAAALVPLSELHGWVSTEEGIVSTAGGSTVAVNYYDVRALDREVPHWSQPLITSETRGLVVLLAQVRADVLQFRVRASHEPGFANAAQLSTPFQRFPGEPLGDESQWDWLTASQGAGADAAAIVLDCQMSEEGGRFFLDLNRYLVVRAPEGHRFPDDDDECWLTLAEITALKHIPGVFTNEFRSALSLLVHYL